MFIIVECYHLLHGHSMNVFPSVASPAELTLTRLILIFEFLYHVMRNVPASAAHLTPVEAITILIPVYL